MSQCGTANAVAVDAVLFLFYPLKFFAWYAKNKVIYPPVLPHVHLYATESKQTAGCKCKHT